MPAIALTNYSTEIHAEVLEKAQKLVVRECDEEGRGRYVAYIDEGDASYDVSLALDKSGAVTTHDCDCGAGAGVFCRHRAALLLRVAEGRKNSTPAIPAAKTKAKVKKAPKWAELLEDASEEELKAVLPKNKELTLAFTHHFTSLRQHYTPAEIKAFTQEGITAVIGKKKRMEQRDLAAIIKLWTGLHQPVVDRYKAALADESCFEGMHAVAESCMDLYHSFGRGPGEIPAYIDRLLKDTQTVFLELKTGEAWDVATGYYLGALFDEQHNSWSIPYFMHLRALILDERSGARGAALLQRLAVAYGALLPQKAYNNSHPNAILFYLLRAHGLLAKHLHMITPIRWDNDFNVALIMEYIQLKQWQAAIRICNQQISGNTREEYNVPYLKILKELYTTLNNEAGKADVMARLLPLDFDFDAFQYIYHNTPDAERKAFRNKILTRARRAWRDGKVAAMRFCFALYIAEGSGLQIIGMIDGMVPYNLLAQYASELAAVSKPALIERLLNRHESSAWGSYDDSVALEARENVPVLVTELLRHYTLEELRTALNGYYAKQKGYMNTNNLVPHLDRTLDQLEYPA